MRKSLAAAIAVLASAGAQAASVDSVSVHQQWPWSAEIMVEYSLSGVTSPVDVSISVYNGDTPIEIQDFHNAVRGDLFGVSADGPHVIYIDPVMLLGGEKSIIPNFKVALSLSDSASNIDEVLYKIFCITNGSVTDVTRAQIKNGEYGPYETDFSKIGDGFSTGLDPAEVLIWTGVTNDIAYKTTHIVMRKINAAGKTWRCGVDSASGGQTAPNTSRRYIQLSKDYFIGVFEMTQGQYTRVNGSNPSYFKNLDDSDIRPAENMKYHELRGSCLSGNPVGSITGELVNWPTNSYLHDVAYSSFLIKLRNKFGGWEFDIPSEARWEFACRGGNDTAFNSGKAATEAAAREVAWSNLDGGGQSHPVGLKKPNAYGLYDMHGNVWEMMVSANHMYLSGSSGEGLTSDDPVIEPLGRMVEGSPDDPSLINTRVNRSGSFGYDPSFETSARNNWHDCSIEYRCAVWYGWTNNRADKGLRLICPVQKQWSPH